MASSSLGKTAVAVPSERPKGSGNPCLVILAGPGMGRRIDLEGGVVDIGRSEACVIPVVSPQVSRRHASIQRVLGRYVVADLESTNGTFVNDRRIQQERLNDGDKIRVGDLVVKYMENSIEVLYHEQIGSLAREDSLTGVYNKRSFDEDFGRYTARAEPGDSPLSLILLDLDHFKSINDTLGHAAGDEVLRRVTSLIRATLPVGAAVYRVGGEEFAILSTGPGASRATELAEELRRQVESSAFSHAGKAFPVTLSLGVAVRRGDGAEQLYERADRKLYEAKRGGRNRVSS
jgi:diguanylate cyclase (GGDEF)-like protein